MKIFNLLIIRFGAWIAVQLSHPTPLTIGFNLVVCSLSKLFLMLYCTTAVSYSNSNVWENTKVLQDLACFILLSNVSKQLIVHEVICILVFNRSRVYNIQLSPL